jgi:uncharacterized membrane protein
MTTHTELHPLARDYLDRLAAAARVLPPDQATELVADISDHLREALRPDADESEVRTVLDRLGTPRELVAAAGGAAEAPAAPPASGTNGLGAVEILALVTLVAAELLFVLWPLAVLLWVAGIILLAVARGWSGRQKLRGFLGLATGFPLAFTTILLPIGGEVSTCTSSSSSATTQTCTSEGGLPGWVGLVALVLLAGYLCLQAWTIWRLTRRR